MREETSSGLQYIRREATTFHDVYRTETEFTPTRNWERTDVGYGGASWRTPIFRFEKSFFRVCFLETKHVSLNYQHDYSREL